MSKYNAPKVILTPEKQQRTAPPGHNYRPNYVPVGGFNKQRSGD